MGSGDIARSAAARAAIRAFWEDQGAHYDTRADHGVSSEAERRTWAAALSVIAAPSRVLDIGTGTGFLALLLAELGHRVTALDSSAGMLGQARAKAAGHDAHVTFEHGDTERLPFGDGCFDAVVSRHVTWTLLEPGRAFAEWRRVLAPGGRLVTDCSLNPEVAGHHYTDDVASALPFGAITSAAPVVQALRAAGFTDIGVDAPGGDDGRAVLTCRI